MTQTANPASVEEQLSGFIDKFEPAIAALVRSVRPVLRERFPTAIELVYDNYNALAIGFGATERASDCIVSLAVFPRSVGLSFYYGATLPDPQGILRGGGHQNRYITLKGPETLADPAVGELLSAAVVQAKSPLPAPGEGGYTVIKSISAKQRPRRPAAK